MAEILIAWASLTAAVESLNARLTETARLEASRRGPCGTHAVSAGRGTRRFFDRLGCTSHKGFHEKRRAKDVLGGKTIRVLLSRKYLLNKALCASVCRWRQSNPRPVLS
jgi:hypothetical protein